MEQILSTVKEVSSVDVFKEVFTTTGRINRRMHLKYQTIWTMLIVLATITSSLMVKFLTGNPESDWINKIDAVLFYVGIIGFLMILTRRLHDLNFSGYFSLLALVPVIGAFFLIALFFAKGQVGQNAYGEEPLED